MKKYFAPLVLTGGLIIVFLLFIIINSLLTHQKIIQENTKPTENQPNHSPSITCTEVGSDLTTTTNTSTFNISKLIPIETRVHSNIFLNKSGVLVFKDYNSGGKIYEIEEKGIKKFGGRGPYYTGEILDLTTRNNTSVIPTTYLPEELNEIISNTTFSGVGYNDSWFILITEEEGLGETSLNQTLYQIIDTDEIKTIKIPKEYTPLTEIVCGGMECGSINHNPYTLNKIIGNNGSTLIFSLTEATSTYVGLDVNTYTWKKLSLSEISPYIEISTLKNRYPQDSTMKKTLNKNGCAYYTFSKGDIIFTPHLLTTFDVSTSSLNETLDIFFYDSQEKFRSWNVLKNFSNN